MENPASYWKNRFSRDLMPFIDLASEIDQIDGPSGTIFRWMQDDTPHEAILQAKNDGSAIRIIHKDRDYTYSQFFASERIGNLTFFAKNILKSIPKGIFAQTLATIEGEQDAAPRPALDAVGDALAAISSDLTKMVMVVADAGSGKTQVLRQLVAAQAQSFLSGKSSFIYFYVDAQGRALSRLFEAVSAQLDELKVKIGYDAITTLCRCGLVIPIIDGFDELLGVSGQDDAFSSIGSFIDELDSAGAIVASARSTYYEQEFLSRASTDTQIGQSGWELKSVRLMGWGVEERRECVLLMGQSFASSENEIQTATKQIEALFRDGSRSLGSKPLFAARTAQMLLEGETFNEKDDLLDALVKLQISRETTEKLKSKSGREILSADQMTLLLQEYAEEMWLQGVRELDRQTVREIADITLGDMSIPEDSRAVAIERASTGALLQRGGRPGYVAFEHEIYYAYFLSRALFPRLGRTPQELSTFLGRSLLPQDVPRLLMKIALNNGGGKNDYHPTVEVLCRASAVASLGQEQARENVGSCIAAICKLVSESKESIRNLTLKNILFAGSDVSDVVFEACEFQDTEFRRTQMAGTLFENCTFRNTQFQAVRMNVKTKFVASKPREDSVFYGLEFFDQNDTRRDIFSPRELDATLALVGISFERPATVQEPNVDQRIIDLVEKLVRAFSHRNPICEQDDYLQGIFKDAYWPKVRNALIRSKVALPELRPAHGSQRDFWRRKVDNQSILTGLTSPDRVSNEIAQFWRLLGA